MKTTMKKLLALLLSVVAVLSLFAACGNKQADATTGNDAPAVNSAETSAASDKTEPAEQITITVGDWPTSAEPEKVKTYEGYVATMKELYPNVTIVPDEYVYGVDTFLPKAASGQLPTVYATYFTEVGKIMNAGYAKDITNALKAVGYDSILNPQLTDLVTMDGHIYGMPKSGYNVGMLYNVELMEQAGLVDENGVPKYASTYEELVEMAVTIKEKTGVPGLFWYTKDNQGGWMFMNLAWAYGVEFMTQEDGKWIATFDSDEAIEAMQYVKDLKWKYDCIQENTLVSGNDMFTAFATNQVAMAYSTLDWNEPLVRTGGADKDNMSLARVPAGPAGRASLMGGNVFMFSPTATDAEVEAALMWLKVIGYSPDGDETTMAGVEGWNKTANEANVPVGPHSMNVWTAGKYYDGVQEIIDEYANVDMKYWRDFEITDDVSIHAEVPMNAQELYKILDDVIQEVLTNKDADVEALMKQANETFQKDYLDNAS